MSFSSTNSDYDSHCDPDYDSQLQDKIISMKRDATKIQSEAKNYIGNAELAKEINDVEGLFKSNEHCSQKIQKLDKELTNFLNNKVHSTVTEFSNNVSKLHSTYKNKIKSIIKDCQSIQRSIYTDFSVFNEMNVQFSEAQAKFNQISFNVNLFDETLKTFQNEFDEIEQHYKELLSDQILDLDVNYKKELSKIQYEFKQIQRADEAHLKKLKRPKKQKQRDIEGKDFNSVLIRLREAERNIDTFKKQSEIEMKCLEFEIKKEIEHLEFLPVEQEEYDFDSIDPEFNSKARDIKDKINRIRFEFNTKQKHLLNA